MALRRLLVLLLVLLAVACGGSPGDTPPSGPGTQPGIGISVSPTTLTSTVAGPQASVAATVSRTGGFRGDVTLSASGAPAGVVTIEPSTLSGTSGNATIRIVAPTGTPTGTYPVTLRATGQGVTEQSTSFTLTIRPTPTIALAAAPTTLTLAPGATTGNAVTVSLSRGGEYDGAVTLALSGAPTGVTGTFQPATLSGTTTQSTLTLSIASGAPVGNAALQVIANGEGVQSASTAFSLTVIPPVTGSFTTVLSSTNGTVFRGGTRGTSVRVTRAGGFTGTVALAITSPLPSGITASVATPALVLPTDSSAITITASEGAAIGSFPLTITALTPGLPPQLLTYTLQVVAAPAPRTTSLEAGAAHVCAAQSTGETLCWGEDDAQRLGTERAWPSNFGQHRTPVIVSTAERFTQAFAGVTHSCALTAQGQAFCWGANLYGQLGTGAFSDDESRPTAVTGGLSFRQLALGSFHTCGLATDARVYCWGENSSRQLGIGAGANRAVPTLVTAERTYRDVQAFEGAVCAVTTAGDVVCWGTASTSGGTPRVVFEGVGFASLSLGRGHACGLDGAGAAFCWGQNNAGQLGDGTTTSSTRPVRVAGAPPFVDIEVGEWFTCGLDATDRAHCWGTNRAGQLGIGSASPADVLTPTAVAGAQRFTELSASRATSPNNGFVCARAVDGQLVCWGANNVGQLGIGSRTFSTVPVAVAGARKFASVSGGTSSACGLTSDGALFCWGENGSGQLGNGAAPTAVATPTPVGGTRRFRSVSVGSNYSCAIDLSDDAWCWGANDRGQLGRGSLTASSVPVLVAGGIKFRQISASEGGGFNHTCALTADGTAYCWGDNLNGAVGDNSLLNRTAPVAVQTGLRFTQIETGGNFTCALSTAGNAHCWGRGALGRLGTGDATNRTVPWPVVGGRTFARITANDEHACGLELDGTAWCWGKNASGQLGDGTTTNRVAPVAVVGVPKLASIVAGGGLIQANTTGFTCGLTANGTLWCWGFNRSGQLMTATTGGAQVTPVQALTTLRFRSLSTFVSGVCAQGLDDETYCWGDGTFGDGTETFTPFLRPKRMFY